MAKTLDILLLVCASVVFGSCNKFSNGDVVTQKRTLDKPFQIVEMCDNVNVTLKHCNADNVAGEIHITTGENLVDNIATEIEEEKKIVTHNGITDTIHFNKLIIRNDNTLNFLRPYDYKLKMTVYYDSLFELNINSNADIITDKLWGYDYWTDFSSQDDSTSVSNDSLTSNLLIYIYGGSGNFSISTNCYKLMTHYQHGTSNLTLHGKVVRAETYGDYDCHGIIDGFDLDADSYHQVTNLGTNIIKAKSFTQIIARNDNIGDIHFLRYRKRGKYIIWGHSSEDNHWIPNDTIDTIYVCPVDHVRRYGAYKENIIEVIDTKIY